MGIERFFLCALVITAVSLPFVLLIRLAFVKRLALRGLVNPMKREVWICVYILYIIAILSVTLFSEFTISDGKLTIVQQSPMYGGTNLRIFDVFRLLRIETFERGRIDFLLFNVIGNILMFVPVGFLTALLWRKPTVWKSLAVGAGFSLLIELCQLPLNRGTDIDDLWLNILGALLGWCIFALTVRGANREAYYISKKETA